MPIVENAAQGQTTTAGVVTLIRSPPSGCSAIVVAYTILNAIGSNAVPIRAGVKRAGSIRWQIDVEIQPGETLHFGMNGERQYLTCHEQLVFQSQSTPKLPIEWTSAWQEVA